LSVHSRSVARSTARPRRSLLGRQALHDHALIGVEVALDALPERRDVGVDRCGRADHLEHAADALFHGARRARRAAQLLLRVGLLHHLAVPLLPADRDLIPARAQQVVPETAEHAALGLEGHVDGLQRDLRLTRDRLHRGRRVAPLLEQPLGRVEDVGARARRLGAAA
jgi:hypothetical protein